MSGRDAIVETIKYSLALVLPESRKVLAIREVNAYRLPSVEIPPWTRPAEQLQKAIKATWGVQVIVLDFLWSEDRSQVCGVAEVVLLDDVCKLNAVSVQQLTPSALDELQHAQLGPMLTGGVNAGCPFSQLGWIYEAVSWLESETGRRLASKGAVEQYNAGGAFSLVRFHTEDDCNYWMKATGEPNAHEPSITRLLSKLCGEYLPEIISFRPAWNAWLMSGNALGVSDWPNDPYALLPLLESAVESMTQLQIRTQGHGLTLLSAGAFDQGIEVFQRRSAELFDYLEEAMSLQTSTKAHRLEKKRLQEIRASFEETCERVEYLGIGESIVHGDLNHGNILTGVGHCQFIDWAEAYLGNPLISLQHLLLLNRVESAEVRDFINGLLKNRYLEIWAANCDPRPLREAYVYMPMLALASTLYGRGDWLDSPLRNDSRRQSYARSLVRYMDRASREPEFMAALCH
jgi:hypothetical protein